MVFKDRFTQPCIDSLVRTSRNKLGNVMNSIALELYNTPNFIYCPDNKELQEIFSLYGGKEEIDVIDVNNSKFYYKLELAMRFGKTCFLKGIQKNLSFDILNLIDSGNTVPGGIFRFGDRETTVDGKFKMRFIIEDKNNDRNIKIIDYSSSIDSIKDEILSSLVTWQQPDLETQQKGLALKKQEFALMIENSEDALLDKLQSSDSNILENTKLWDSLDTIKTQVNDITESLAQIESVNKEIETQRQIFAKAAEKIGGVFECLINLHKLNALYAFTKDSLFIYLNDYLSDYKQEFDAKPFVKGFIVKIIEMLNVGLEETDRLPVLLELIVLIGLFDRPGDDPKTLDNFLDMEAKDTLFKVLFLETKTKKKYFEGLNIPQHIKGEERDILAKLNKAYPELINKICETRPGQQVSLSSSENSVMNNMIVARVLYPDRLIPSIESFIMQKLGENALKKEIDFERIINKTLKAKRPLLLILKGTNDPTDTIEQIVASNGSKVETLIIGNVTEQAAQNLIESYCKTNCTLIVKNMHLLPDLNKTISSVLNLETPDPQFRLIITSELVKTYSNVFFDMCYKVIIENRPNIYNTFTNCENLMFNKDHKNKLISNYSFTHALLQERLNYIPTGFVKNYNFNINDVYTARKMFEQFASNKSVGLIKDMICNFIYISKVDNLRDEEVIKIYFDKYFNEEFDAMSFIHSNDVSNINPDHFGLDMYAAYLKNLDIRDNLFEKLKLLNSETIDRLYLSADTSVDELTNYLESWNQLKQVFTYSKSSINFSTEGLNFLMTGEVVAARKLIIELNLIETQIKSHLKAKIRLTEVHGYEYLLKGEIPEHVLNIWGYQRKFRDYFESLKTLKHNFETNSKNMRINERVYQMNGFIDISKFFEVQNLIFVKEKSIDNLVLYCDKNSSADSYITLQSLYMQGACIEDSVITLNAKKNDAEPYEFIKALSLTYTDGKMLAKLNDVIEIPLYYDIRKEKLITFIKFHMDANIKRQDIILSSACLFVYK